MGNFYNFNVFCCGLLPALLHLHANVTWLTEHHVMNHYYNLSLSLCVYDETNSLSTSLFLPNERKPDKALEGYPD